MDVNNMLTEIEQKVLAIGEMVGIALANNEQIDNILLASELHGIYNMIGEFKKMKNNMRKAEILFGGNWVEVSFDNIKKGDVFRLFESNGTPVRDRGTTMFIAKEDAYFNDGWETFMIDCDTYYG